MPTFYTDEAYRIDLSSPPPAGTTLNFSQITIEDRNDNGIIGPSTGAPGQRDRVDGGFVTNIRVGDTITVRLADGSVVTITGVTFYTNAGAYFTPTDGTVLTNGVTFLGSTTGTGGSTTTVPAQSLAPVCYTPGALILTPDGERPVEDLRPGDLVVTRDRGARPVLWAGAETVPGTGAFAPVAIRAGALGNRRDLLVSPQHRMLVRGWQAELLAGLPEVLVAAVHLVNDRTILRAPRAEVTYVHFMLDRHEIVFAEGAESESLDPSGDRAAADREIARLFPELAAPRGAGTVRPTLRAWEGRAMAV